METQTIGNCTLYCGDCLELIKEIKSDSVDTIICDAPYFQGLTHNGKKGELADLITCKPFFKELFIQFDRVCRDKRCVYFFTDWRGQSFYYPILDEIMDVKNLLIWDKQSGCGSSYTNCHELILFHSETNRNMKGSNVIRNIKSFSSGARVTDGEKVHPAQKTIALIEKLIIDSSKQGMIVLDPMMGGGSTGVACIRTDRKFIGMEIQHKYFDIACRRMEKAMLDDRYHFPEFR